MSAIAEAAADVIEPAQEPSGTIRVGRDHRQALAAVIAAISGVVAVVTAVIGLIVLAR